MSECILNELDRRRQSYVDFSECIERLLHSLIRGEGMRVQGIYCRIKSRESLSKKLSRPNKNYSTLASITDICGVRVLTYFREDVDAIAKILEAEFDIDKQHSIDKRKYDAPDRFGYQSLHYVVTLGSKRSSLAEYKKFKDFRAEIQLRTVIQHAWAEIEHDLGYKNELSVPIPIRRKFSRLSAILEMADEEFSHIKENLSIYEQGLPDKIRADAQEIPIDLSSLRAFVTEGSEVKSLALRVAQSTGADIESPDQDYLARMVSQLIWVGIESIGDLRSALTSMAGAIERLMIGRFNFKSVNEFPPEAVLLYLCYAVLAKNGDRKRLIEFLNSFYYAGDNALFSEGIIDSLR